MPCVYRAIYRLYFMSSEACYLNIYINTCSVILNDYYVLTSRDEFVSVLGTLGEEFVTIVTTQYPRNCIRSG